MSSKAFDFSISLDLPLMPEVETTEIESAGVTPESADGPIEDEDTVEAIEDCSAIGTEGTSAAASKRREVDLLVSSIRDGIIEGKSDTAIAEELSLSQHEFRRLKTRLYEQMVDGLASKTAEIQYADYRLEQERCLRELDTMIGSFRRTRQYNAMVGAVRAKSQILGDMHKTGINMGVIKQEASFDREVAGVRISELDNADLRKMIAETLGDIKRIIDKFTDAPMGDVETLSPMADPSVARVKH